MATYREQMLRITELYRDAGRTWPATAREIAGWAIAEGLWVPSPSSIVAQCADHLAQAMREEYYTDPQGRTVRTKHAARLSVDGEQTTLWDDIRTADAAFMEMAFAQRRQQILSDCRQLKADVDSFNDNNASGVIVQMIFDFTLDLEEEALV